MRASKAKPSLLDRKVAGLRYRSGETGKRDIVPVQSTRHKKGRLCCHSHSAANMGNKSDASKVRAYYSSGLKSSRPWVLSTKDLGRFQGDRVN